MSRNWVVIIKHSAFETTYTIFDTEAKAKAHYDYWNDAVYSHLDMIMAEIKEQA